MIDMHCHLLPNVDDGARDLATALEMARIAAADGITTIVCTPHITPGLFDNTGESVRAAVAALQGALDDAAVPVHLEVGADVHIAPDLCVKLDDGRVPTLAGSRYLLFEPPHRLAPPRFEETVFGLLAAGYLPVITHPERLDWIEGYYARVERLAQMGVWMQVTAGSLTGLFGRKARYWAERLLDEGWVQLLATDAHDAGWRRPVLSAAREAAAMRLGAEEARHLVLTRPRAILRDRAPAVAATPVSPISRSGARLNAVPG